MDHITLLLSLLESVQDNNFYLYAKTLHSMTPTFFSFRGQNYARYLSFYTLFLANVDISHPGAKELLMLGGNSVARSFTPGNRAAVDKSMEETFMRHAKSRTGGTGLTGLLTNYSAYQRWVRTTHTRCQYTHSSFQMAGMVEDNNNICHKDVRQTERLKSEEYVKKTQEVICSFVNPFDVGDKSSLVVISSGAIVPAEVTFDILRAERAGETAHNEFVSSRLETGTNFFQPISRLGLKSFSDLNKKTKLSHVNNKLLQYKEQSNQAFQLLIKSQNEGLQLDLRELMSFPLTAIPFSIGLPGHFMVKTDKCKLFHKTCDHIEDAAIPSLNETLSIIDGNATYHCLRDIPNNFREICHKIFNMLPKGDVVSSTDSYFENFIKCMERKRRGVSDKLLLRGSATKKPPDWKQFLANDETRRVDRSDIQ